MDLFTIFIYVSVIIAFLAAFYLEYKDLFCPHDNRAEYGKGAAYAAGKVDKHDNSHTILQKIRISSRYDEGSVYWRRTIIFTVIVLFSVLILSLQKLPNAYEIIVSFIVIYLLTFLFLNYYQNTVSKYATRQITEATKILAKRISF